LRGEDKEGQTMRKKGGGTRKSSIQIWVRERPELGISQKEKGKRFSLIEDLPRGGDYPSKGERRMPLFKRNTPFGKIRIKGSTGAEGFLLVFVPTRESNAPHQRVRGRDSTAISTRKGKRRPSKHGISFNDCEGGAKHSKVGEKRKNAKLAQPILGRRRGEILFNPSERKRKNFGKDSKRREKHFKSYQRYQGKVEGLLRGKIVVPSSSRDRGGRERATTSREGTYSLEKLVKEARAQLFLPVHKEGGAVCVGLSKGKEAIFRRQGENLFRHRRKPWGGKEGKKFAGQFPQGKVACFRAGKPGSSA